MPYTVWGAFDTFRKETVDLDPEATRRARSSRDYLLTQLKALYAYDSACPKIVDQIPYGSFARKTKIRPLDDIDLLALLIGKGTTAEKANNADPYEYWLRIKDDDAALAPFDDGCGYVSSIKVLNQLKKSLSNVGSYSKAEIKRNQQAVVLNLTSYTWVFDIVAAVPIRSYYSDSTDFYLIPDGSGDWIKTDPRKDTAYVTKVNQQHDGWILPTIRLLKFWNQRTHKPRLSSYYFETLVLRTFDYASKIESLPKALRYFFNYCPLYLDLACPDPKGLGPNLDQDVDSETKGKIKAAMKEAASNADLAVYYEAQEQYENGINAWKKVFGPSFPSYGS